MSFSRIALCLQNNCHNSGCQNVVSTIAASILPGKLSEKQILRSHPLPTESDVGRAQHSML